MSARFVFGASAAYLAVMLGERLAGLVVMPLMTRALTPADYGVMLLIANGAGVINLLFGFSLAQALPTLFAHSAAGVVRRALCTTVLVSIVAISGVLYLAVALFSRPISLHFLNTPDYAGAVALGALASFLNSCALCLMLLARLSERHTLYLAIQIPTLILQVVLIVSLVALGALNLQSQYAAVAIASLFATAMYAMTLWPLLSGRFEARQLARVARISAQMLPWQFATLVTTNSAAFFLARTGHLADSGLFLIANSAAALLVAISTSVENVWTPFVLLRKDQPDLARTQFRVFSLYSSALLVAAAALSLFAHELFVILAGPAFRDGYRFVPALCLVYCLFGFANAFAQGLQARQRTVHYAWIGLVVAVVFVALALALAGRLGVWGIIAAMGGGFLAMLVLLQIVSARFLPVGYPWPRHGAMWLVAAVVVFYAYPLDIGWTGFSIKIAALVCIMGLPFLFGAVRSSDLRLAKTTILAAIH